jgi:hypothetical protein
MSEPFKPYKVDTELNKLKIPNTGARFMRTFGEVSPEDSSVKINIRVYLSSVSTLIEEYL